MNKINMTMMVLDGWMGYIKKRCRNGNEKLIVGG